MIPNRTNTRNRPRPVSARPSVRPGGITPSDLTSEAGQMRDTLRKSVYGELQRSLMAMTGYQNADSSRLRPDSLNVRGGSADSHRYPITRDWLRKSCQELDRNNVLCRGLVQRLTDMIVGDGFTLQARAGEAGNEADDAWNDQAEDLFNEWAKNCGDSAGIDIRGRMSLDDMAVENVRCACIDGDVGYVLTSTGQLQAVEAERIRNPQSLLIDGLTSDGTLMIGGVEMSKNGKVIRYHVADWANLGTYGSFATWTTTPVQADSFILLTNPIRQITGATRGEPQLQACIDKFEHLEGFDQSVRVAARVQACLAAFVVVERPDLHQQMWPGEQTTEMDEDGNDETAQLNALEPGMMKYLRPGESIETVNPSQPGPDYESFMMTQVLFICADLGLPLPLALLDGRQVNLSSIRSVLQFAWRHFERWQSWLKDKFYSRVYRWRIAMFIREGKLAYRDDWDKHEWICPPAPMMDPKTEYEAARVANDSRFMSRERIMRSMGIEFDEESEQIAKEMEYDREHGIAPVAAPGVQKAGGGDSPPAGSDQTVSDIPGDSETGAESAPATPPKKSATKTPRSTKSKRKTR